MEEWDRVFSASMHADTHLISTGKVIKSKSRTIAIALHVSILRLKLSIRVPTNMILGNHTVEDYL
jgi:hypothetical protein